MNLECLFEDELCFIVSCIIVRPCDFYLVTQKKSRSSVIGFEEGEDEEVSLVPE